MPAPSTAPRPDPRGRLLLFSVLVVATCGLVYELIIGTLSSYLLGSTITHFSLTVGLFLSAMGIGAWASRWVRRDVLSVFVLVEIAIGALEIPDGFF